VPLSEHEQRLLEQIEQALYAEDPKFASIYRSNDLRSHQRRRIIRASVFLVIGLGLLLTGVIIKLPIVGVAGFVIMLGAVTFGVAAWQRMVAPARPSQTPAAADGSGGAAARRGPPRHQDPTAPSCSDSRSAGSGARTTARPQSNPPVST
jgi:hypothetical protein